MLKNGCVRIDELCERPPADALRGQVAHLAREFRALAGRPPSQWLAELR
jgi:hypothetical protein